MLALRPTRNLIKRLELPKPEAASSSATYLTDWGVREFQVGRYRYLLFANTASLFPVVTMSRGVTDLATLVGAFANGFRAAWHGTPAMAKFEHAIEPVLSQVQIVRDAGRSYLGSTNDLAHMAYFSLSKGDPIAECSRRIAEAPMGFLGMNSPECAFAKLGQPSS